MAMDQASTLVETLKQFRLLDASQLDEVSRMAVGAFKHPLQLMKELVRRGWLTLYQGNQIFQGNARGLVIGRHRVLDRLGEGGVSHVFKAWDTKLGRVVALKVIREELATNPEALGRFKREIEAVMRLSHPNIVRAFDGSTEGNLLFIAMELVQGNDLAKLVKLSGPLPAARASLYLRQAALGLQHAHENGLIHRDIKPANILLVADTNVVKLLDLGLSRPHGTDSILTTDGSIIGSPDFMSPEQARRPSGVDIRSDIYSLGCTGYFLLTGQVPFPGNSLLVKMTGHESKEPTPIEQLAPQTPPGLIAVIHKMTAKKPEARYATPAAAAEALAPFCA